MVSRARDIFFQARQEVDSWLSTALEPLTFQIREHKEQMERRLLDLQKISRSRDTLESRLSELEQQHNAVAKQLTILRNIHHTLNASYPLAEEARPKPKLVAARRTAS
jgi:chromosome segregation ATPase